MSLNVRMLLITGGDQLNALIKFFRFGVSAPRPRLSCKHSYPIKSTTGPRPFAGTSRVSCAQRENVYFASTSAFRTRAKLCAEMRACFALKLAFYAQGLPANQIIELFANVFTINVPNTVGYSSPRVSLRLEEQGWNVEGRGNMRRRKN